MIVYGTRGKVIPGPQKRGVPCSACGMDVHATFGVLRWFHLFWIPTFPTMRQPAMECLHCKKTLVGKELPERVRADVAAAVFTRRRMVPTFAGAMLIAAFAMSTSIVGARERASEEAYLRAPAVGDVDVEELAGLGAQPDPKFPYGVLRVTQVSAGGVEVSLGGTAYSVPSAAENAVRQGEARRDGYFTESGLQLGAGELERWRKERTIASVTR